MLELAFSRTNLLRCISYRELEADASLKDPANRELAGAATAKLVAARTVFSEPMRAIQIRKKTAYQFPNIYQALTCRLISRNIKRNYKIAPQSRNSIVRNLSGVLQESYPIKIQRADIQSFFEEIDRDKLLDKILNDGKCSHHTALMLYDFFRSLKSQGIKGVPRGLGISSTLAELVLADFDRAMQGHPEVFLYCRFVDDILISMSDKATIATAVKEKLDDLPPPLKIHKSGQKYGNITVKRTSTVPGHTHSFEYLGYSFRVGETVHPTRQILGNLRRHVSIEIADNKIEKIKARVISSFISFISSKHTPDDFSLLRDRICALTGNYYICDPFTGVKIKTGIFYNYAEKNEFNKCHLHSLDALLRGIIFSRKHRLSVRVAKFLGAHERFLLKGYTFKDGFHKKRFYTFSYRRLAEIKECWEK